MTVAVLMTIGAVGFSARSLPYGYRYPKQDFEQAVKFVDELETHGDRVAMIGITAVIPFKDYFGKLWPRVDHVDQLHKLSLHDRGILLVYTFPAYIRAQTPELWKMIENDCVPVKRFHGTVAGGDIHVRRCSP